MRILQALLRLGRTSLGDRARCNGSERSRTRVSLIVATVAISRAAVLLQLLLMLGQQLVALALLFGIIWPTR